MIQKIILCVIMCAFIGMPHTSYGALPDADTYTQKLSAISSYLNRTYNKNTEPLSDAELVNIIRDGVSWMKQSQETNGHFKYEYVPYEDTYKDDDNIVRQAGALYMLGEVVRREKDTDDLEETIERAVAYFESLSKTGTYEGKTFRCIVEQKESNRCKLGATSLALIGTLSFVHAYPDQESKYRNLIEAYAEYLLVMQKESGGFREIYRIDAKVASEKESPFANGEALLALVRYYEYKIDTGVKNAIDRAFTYLKAQPFDNNLYLWIMAAVKDMHVLWPNETYVTYARAFTSVRMESGIKLPRTRNYCAYAEGLASAASLLKEDPLYSKLRSELDIRNKNHAALQLQSEDVMRIIETDGKLTFKELKNPEYALGGFLVSDAESTQRIDFTQHCLGAYIQTLVDIDEKELL